MKIRDFCSLFVVAMFFDKDGLLSQSSLGHPKVYFLVGASNNGVSCLEQVGGGID